MKFINSAAAVAMFCALGTAPVLAACNISDAELEEAILENPELREPQNRQIVLDLRNMRDAAYLLWTYKMDEDCERLIGNIRELIASPSIATIGTNDEDAADQQLAASEPQWHRLGQIEGNRGQADEAALISIDDLDPGLLANELIGAEVRTSDDMIVGEVRNVVIGTKDRWDYVIVASGGFFVPGRDSLVVPLRYLVIDKERQSFFLRISSDQVKSVPLMPDQSYLWLDDDAWCATNDAIFRDLLGDDAG